MSDPETRPLSTAELDAWLRAYGNAWEAKDPDAAAGLFTADAEYYETPYAEAFAGRAGIRDYWARVTTDQQGVRFTYAVIAVTGRTGVATWSAHFASISGGVDVELNGAFVLEFESAGQCRVLREWWHAR